MQSANLVRQQTEDDLVMSPENVQVAFDMIDALCADDDDEVDRLAKKMIVPANLLKVFGKEFVLRKGLPTITCELADDTKWLK